MLSVAGNDKSENCVSDAVKAGVAQSEPAMWHFPNRVCVMFATNVNDELCAR